MTRQANVWAGSALALLMACAPGTAAPAIVLRLPAAPSATLVQDQPTEEELRRQQQQQEVPAEPTPETAPQPEAQPQPEAAPQPEPEPAPAPEAAPEQPPAAEPRSEEPAATDPQQPSAEQTAPGAPVEEQPSAEGRPADQAPAPQTPQEAPAEESPVPPTAEQPAPQAPPVEAPATETPAAPEQTPAPQEAPADAPAAEPAQPDAGPLETAPAEQQPSDAAPTDQMPAGETPEQAPTPEESPAEQAPGQVDPAPAGQPAQSGDTPAEITAPVLDSQKQALPPAAADQGQSAPAQSAPPAPAGQAAQPAPAEPATPPPADDRAAQQAVAPVAIQPVTAEEGTRVEREPDIRRQQRPRGADVLREIGDRVIIQFNNQVIVESNDRPRMARGARDVFYEDLPRGRTRETIVRENGVQVVTIRNRYGDVIRRSRIMPDGTEYILSYVDDNEYEVRDWRDPGDDLPPMVLAIPVEDYILDAERVEDPDLYYEFLDQPPVETVERLYSVDEVKRSARVRDKTRRVDLDTVTFEFGSASIVESEIPRLQGVADAMEKLLEKNPAETFLIEGHTDAVGSDVANLALSDRRAEAVADALANVFGIPPENLTTQGYGERYLKVRTQAPERENRRVAIRRITALVAPVASAR